MAPLALISDGNGLIVMTVIFDVLVIASVALRLKARFLTKAGLKTDDWLAVVALVRFMMNLAQQRTSECLIFP